jgi:riboflavin synthase alpha subunit
MTNNNTKEKKMSSELRHRLLGLNDELVNCRKAVSQAGGHYLSGQVEWFGVVQRLRSMEKNIVRDIRKTEKIIENRG